MQCLPEARRFNDSIGDQLEVTRPACVHCGAKLWFPGQLNNQMQQWCVKASCNGLPEDVTLVIQYMLLDEVMMEERGILCGVLGDGHQEHVMSSEACRAAQCGTVIQRKGGRSGLGLQPE